MPVPVEIVIDVHDRRFDAMTLWCYNNIGPYGRKAGGWWHNDYAHTISSRPTITYYFNDPEMATWFQLRFG